MDWYRLMRIIALELLVSVAACCFLAAKAATASRTTELLDTNGTSMLPTIESGSTVLIDRDVSVLDLDLGDIIVWQRGDGTLICHRVSQISRAESGAVRTKGDHNQNPDFPLVDDTSLVGRVTAINPSRLEILNATDASRISTLAAVEAVLAAILMTLSYYLERRHSRATQAVPSSQTCAARPLRT